MHAPHCTHVAGFNLLWTGPLCRTTVVSALQAGIVGLPNVGKVMHATCTFLMMMAAALCCARSHHPPCLRSVQ